MVSDKVVRRRKTDMKTCEAHPELLKLVTEVTMGLDYLQLGQDEMKKTLVELKNSQQKVFLDIQNILLDAKDFTRGEAKDLDTKIRILENKVKSIAAVGTGITFLFVALEFLFKTGIIKLGVK